MGKIKDQLLFEAEVAALYADRFDPDDMPGSEAYHQGLINEAAVAMYDRIELLEVIVKDQAEAEPNNSLFHDMTVIIATMRQLMPALDR